MVRRLVNWGSILLSLLFIAAALAWFAIEARLSAFSPDPDPVAARRHAFEHGPIGLEILPFKYAAVLDELSATAMKPRGREESVWEVYGFLARDGAPAEAKLCAANADRRLPVGVNVTHYLPERAAVTPVRFVGLTCAACHSARVLRPDGTASGVILGAGNPALDAIGFTDAVRNAVLDPALDAARILAAYEAQCPEERTPWPLSWAERLAMQAWLDAFRAKVQADTAKYGLPVAAPHLLDAAHMPAGPGRTRPFRSVVRVALDLPGEGNLAFSKIPAVVEQGRSLRPRSQYDGSIREPVTRALIAAYASGATPLALSRPEMAHSVTAAAEHTEALGTSEPLPAFRDIFGGPEPDPARLEAGRALYLSACAGCHGQRDPGTGAWIARGERIGEVMALAEIGTDPARVTFAEGRLLPLALWTAFPGADDLLAAQKRRLAEAAEAARAAGDMGQAGLWLALSKRLAAASRQFRLGHPFAFAECEGATCACAAERRRPDDPAPTEAERAACALTAEMGYVNAPIPSAWLRAPYLHNGSVPTLAALLNLADRPMAFCRGRNAYDPEAVGLAAPAPGPEGCPWPTPHLFDARLPGNLNTGHDYPWTRAEVAADPAKQAALADLLLYVRGL